MRRLSHAALAAALILSTLVSTFAVSTLATAATGDVTAELSPPPGLSAVSDGERLSFGGQVPAGSEPGAVLQAVDDVGTISGTFDVTVTVDETGAVSGGITIGCFYVPGCDDAVDQEGQQAARDGLGGYRLQLTVDDVSDVSDQVDYDNTPPIITSYALTSPTTVLVRFSEDVTDPEGDDPSDWVVDGLRQVTSVAGVGDSRTLTFPLLQSSDGTPEVRYLPTPSPDPAVPNVPYIDRARNELDAENRFALAADEIPPPVPSITEVEGQDVTYEDQDQAVPVLGNEPAPTFTVDDVPEGVTTQVFLDDGDGAFEPGVDDILVGEGVGDVLGQATVTPDTTLADGVHRFYARSVDEAACDPNDPDSGTCPNASGRSQEARYDLDTVPPTPVGDALSHESTIVVQFSEPLIGADDAGQWTVTNPGGGAVTVEEVSGSGDTRTLQFSGGPIVDSPTPTLDWTAPGSDAYRDEHGNVLTGFPVDIVAAPLPLLTVDPADAVEGDPPEIPDNPLDPPPTLDFTLRVSGLPAGEEVEVAYETVLGGDGDAGADDYEHTSGTVTITGVDGGTAETVVSVTVKRDLLDEFDEDVFLEVRNVDDTAPQFTLPGAAASLNTAATIADDDDPVVATIGPASANVGEGDAVELGVELDAVSGKPVTIDWATEVADDPAEGEAGVADVPAQSGSVTIPAGEQRRTFSVEVADDEAVEAPEDFAVNLTAPDNANATLGDPASATLTIIDDDQPLPTLSVEPGSVTEDDALLPAVEGAQLPYTFRLSTAPEQAIEVGWTTTDAGSATGDADFVADAGRVRFEAGQTEQVLHIEVIDDELDEDDETVAVKVVEPAGADLEGGATTLTSLGTIVDDDPVPTVMFADGSEEVMVTEGADAPFTVELGAVSGRDVSVHWETVFDGTADTADVPAQSGTVVVPAGATSATFEVDTEDDDAREGDEDLSVVLSDPEHAQLSELGPTTARLVLLDDDLPVLRIEGGSVDEGAVGTLGTAGPGTGLEAASVGAIRDADGATSQGLVAAAVSPLEEDLVFTATLADPMDQDVTVHWTTTDLGTATAGSDYTAESGTLTIPAGETEGEVLIDGLPDDLDEFDETVVVRFSDPEGARFPDGAASVEVAGTILDDDPLVTVSLADDVEVSEGEPATFEALLDTASGKDVTVRLRTRNGSAAAGQDYRATDETRTIPAGETRASFTVPTLDDSTFEPTEEAEVLLSVIGDDTAALGRSVATLTIRDDDLGVDPNDNLLSLSGDAVPEGDPFTPLGLPMGRNQLAFELRLSRPADGDVVVDYETRAGTATADDDFEPDTGQVTIPDGDSSAVVAVEVVPDLHDEFDEQLQLVLTGVSGDAVLPGGQVARGGTIVDDDPAARLRVSDATVLAGDTASVEVTLDTASGKDITVDFDLVAGTAAAGEDYVDDSGTLSFPAGTTSRTVDVQTLVDADDQFIQQFELVLSGAVNAALDDPRGTVSIVDVTLGDGLAAISLEDERAKEGDSDHVIQVPVRLSNPRDADTTAVWSTQQLTATDGEDYRGDSGEVLIPAGETEASIPITILGDIDPERDEDFLVLLTEADGAVITGPAGRVTIEDDDSGDRSKTPGDGPGSDDDVDGAPDGSGGGGGGQGAGQLPATGGGAGFLVFGLALLAARRRRREER